MIMSHYLLGFLLVVPILAQAQTDPTARHATVLDLSGATGSGLRNASIAGWRLWGIDRGGRFQAGLGGRATYFWGQPSAFDNQNAPTQPVQLLVSAPRLLALNLAFHVRARVAGPIGVGFNLDFLGASVGSAQPATLSDGRNTAATPVRLNVLKGGSPDQGSLNSELYVRVALPQGFSLRGGWSHLVTAHAVDDTRYRKFRNLASLGLSYEL